MVKFGWIRDGKDVRDKMNPPIYLKLNNVIKKSVDLRRHFSEVEDQKTIGSCTACAAAGIVEYYEKVNFNNFTELSRLFTYKTSRNLLGITDDGGSTIRATMGALNIFGSCPERFCKYDVKNVNKEPSAFQYSLGQRTKSIDYYRVSTLDDIKLSLSNSIPVIFGFNVYENYTEADEDGIFPMPYGDIVGGHAIVAIGYTNSNLIIRNSWGTLWGDKGYGYIPFEYLTNDADDFWCLVKKDYVNIDSYIL
jgi:C1A family cysteine protease